MRDGSNHRSDTYGRSLDNRMGFPLEVLEAVLGVWLSERVGIRPSPSGTMVRRLNDYDLAYLHLMEPMSNDPRHGSPQSDGLIPAALRRQHRGQRRIQQRRGGSRYRHESGRRGGFRQDVYRQPESAAMAVRKHGPERTNPTTFYGGDERGYIDYLSLEEATA
ncbi:oxidoreductase [Salinisphaera orenii]|uniref:oxidoreductase n=1 Tax=Salinisphaera orenii TaxID=856731 RepID=UPI0019551825